MMRKSFRLRNSSAHKKAVKALYKSYLQRTALLPVPDGVKNEVREKIRGKFRWFKHETSYERLHKLLIAAYENQHTFLLASTPDHPQQHESLLVILHTLQRIYNRNIFRLERDIHDLELESTRPIRENLLPLPKKPRFPPHPLGPLPPVPSLIDANSFPLLRWRGRPQSEEVSSVIRKKIKQKDARALYREKEHAILVEAAKAEDMWDRIVERALDEAGAEFEEDASYETYEDTMKVAEYEIEVQQKREWAATWELTKKFVAKRWEMMALREKEIERRRRLGMGEEKVDEGVNDESETEGWEHEHARKFIDENAPREWTEEKKGSLVDDMVAEWKLQEERHVGDKHGGTGRNTATEGWEDEDISSVPQRGTYFKPRDQRYDRQQQHQQRWGSEPNSQGWDSRKRKPWEPREPRTDNENRMIKYTSDSGRQARPRFAEKKADEWSNYRGDRGDRGDYGFAEKPNYARTVGPRRPVDSGALLGTLQKRLAKMENKIGHLSPENMNLEKNVKEIKEGNKSEADDETRNKEGWSSWAPKKPEE